MFIVVLGVIGGIGWITLYHVIYPMSLRQLFLWLKKRVIKYWLKKELIQSEYVTNQTNEAENGEQVTHPNIWWIWREIKSEEEISSRRQADNNHQTNVPLDKPIYHIIPYILFSLCFAGIAGYIVFTTNRTISDILGGIAILGLMVLYFLTRDLNGLKHKIYLRLRLFLPILHISYPKITKKATTSIPNDQPSLSTKRTMPIKTRQAIKNSASSFISPTLPQDKEGKQPNANKTIEAKALRKLRHPNRAVKLKDFL